MTSTPPPPDRPRPLRTAAVIPAAGRGIRLGPGAPKALRALGGTPMLIHAVRAMAASRAVSLVVVVAPPDGAPEVKHLLDIVEIKSLCRQAGVEQIDAGPKGAVIAFRNKSFANPEGLIAFIREEGTGVKLQPDHRLIYYADWETPEERLAGTRNLLRRLVDIAAQVKKAA